MVKWKLLRVKETGNLCFTPWQSHKAKQDGYTLIEVDNFIFDDELRYIDCEISASTAIVHFKSKKFPHNILFATMRFLDNLFDANKPASCKITNDKPLTITGKFTFVKNGRSIFITHVI